MKKIVIIGAGLTGLSTAYHLEKEGFFDYEIYEKENKPGGLCKSIYQDGFTFDYTGHLLHINDSYFQNLINQITNIKQFEKVIRQSFIYSHNTYTQYPFQINLYGLPKNIIVDCITEFVERKKTIGKPKTFHQWVLKCI